MSGPQTDNLARTNPNLASLRQEVARCMSADQRRLRSMLRQVEQRLQSRQPADRLLRQAEQFIRQSIARRDVRARHLPKPTFPENLPVVERKQEVADAIARHQVVILCGETGSGKTTQLPKICLELGRGAAGLIGHTQPRRIAARSVSMRIAQELNSPLGEVVGYKVRFADKLSERTVIKVMTDGILLAETQNDPLLEHYDTVIIDEAHERSLNIDFLLGYLKRLLPRRPDLKLIITSATIDPERFSRHFNNAPILNISGRVYPVEVRYNPLASDNPDQEDLLMEDAILRAVDELGHSQGDILIFLPGERDIREVSQLLRKQHPPQTEILPLYARLSADEQMKVFKPHPNRRIILSTNVAETSLTVPGIRFVIDTGLARISRYSARTKVQRLPIEPISQASADQRKGRCGRVAAGVCIRLFSEQDYLSRAQYTDPEILRTNLASVILQMKAFGLGDVQEFPFIQPPDYRAIKDGYQTLHELGAIDDRNELTPLGRNLARLPIDPRIGRMILAAQEEQVMREVLIIASALSVQDPRERPMDKQELADIAHAKFREESSDFLAYVKLWTWYHDNARRVSGSKLRRLCQENFLSFIRMREWHDIHQQLLGLVSELRLDKKR